MPPSAARRGSVPRLLVTYALVVAVPVVLLGVVLSVNDRAEAQRRGVDEGRSEALLVAQTAVEPVLDGRPLSAGLSAAEESAMRRLVARAVGDHDVLRLRLRDLAGNVVFSDDGSGFHQVPEDEAIDAAHGIVTADLTHLNADSNDVGPVGPAAVEVYLPLTAGAPEHRVGVLEVYLPYAPIDADVSAGLHRLTVDLVVDLLALYVVLFVISVSVSRRLRHQVRANKFLAEHDALTELPNRSLFHQRAQHCVNRAVRSDSRAALAIIDLDRFKEVNDTLGHHNGDQLLTQLARRLADHIRPQDAVARLGGDEFGVILSDVTNPEEVLHRLREIIVHEVDVSGLPLSIESSIGYVVAPDDGIDVDDLLQHADVAMYLAKARHLGVARYDPDHDHYDATNLGLIAELRRGIDAGELVLHYQPKATLDERKVEAVEALVRWRHPRLGLLYPDRFIPLAEQTEVIDALTTWVLRRALTDVRDLDGVAVSVNVSARTLGRGRFAPQVVAMLRELEVASGRLIVEITETALLTDPPRAAAVLSELDAAGVGVSLDDFGIGQTSLGYLSSLPVHELKIDKSFVMDMLANPAHAAIVRSIVDLGHNLSLRVVAEGVETDDVFASLGVTGCDLAQGYLLARPMPVDQLRIWLSTVPTPRPAAV
ncbi:MAG TPA: bifunctional diguanylate cyclase/phosphodiesterase [Acidimicrobiales bacterium]|nr:bifunctional diguanylate cyclase/phosphodiesterase [Acidimicrobiales bacterium]